MVAAEEFPVADATDVRKTMPARQPSEREMEFADYNISDFRDALAKFAPPTQPTVYDEQTPVANNDTLADSEDIRIDAYLAYVGKNGSALFEWAVVKPVVLWKMDAVMRHMLAICPPPVPRVPVRIVTEGEEEDDDHAVALPLVSAHAKQMRTLGLCEQWSECSQMMHRILKALDDMDGIPFTFQRICELLTIPLRYYRRADKLLRGLEKTVMVQTCIDVQGQRVLTRAQQVSPTTTAAASAMTPPKVRRVATAEGDLPTVDSPSIMRNEQMAIDEATREIGEAETPLDPEVSAAMARASRSASTENIVEDRPESPVPPPTGETPR